MQSYTIQQAAALTGLSEHTLRYYERISLITPVRRQESPAIAATARWIRLSWRPWLVCALPVCRLGNDRARLIEVLTQLLPFISYTRMLNGLRAIDQVIVE